LILNLMDRERFLPGDKDGEEREREREREEEEEETRMQNLPLWTVFSP